MATTILGVSTPSTSNASSYASGAFTPAAGDLLIAFVVATGTVHPTSAAAMTDSQSLGWDLLAATTFNGGADSLFVFAARKPAAASSMTVTFACSGDAATGANVGVMRIAGADGVYVRQVAVATGAASTTPAVTLDNAIDSANPLVGCVGNGTNPATITAPGSWTESSDTGYNTPACGIELVRRDSGATGSTVTWGSTSGTAWAAAIVEVYNSGSGVVPDDSVGVGTSGYVTAV